MRTAFVISLLVVIATSVRADEPAGVRAVIDKAVQAHGGADKLASIKAEIWKTSGTSQSGDNKYEQTKEYFVQGLEQAREVTESQVMGMVQQIVQAVNGNKGLLKTLIRGQQLGYRVDNKWIAEQKEQNYSRRITSLQPFAMKEEGLKLDALGETEIDGKPVVGVRVSAKEHREVLLYFDKKDGLLLKAEFTLAMIASTGEQIRPDIKQEIFYSVYKDFDATKKATKMVIKLDGKVRSESELTEYKRVDKLDDDVFDR